METEWRVARAQLREQLIDNPQSTHEALATQLGYSVSWVRKWRKRLANTPLADQSVLSCESHRPKRLAKQVSEAVEIRIIALRLALSEQFNRTVGGRTIAAYLKQEAETLPGIVPTSSRTIWRILRRRQYILKPQRVEKQPFERPEPGLQWEVDFCTAANASPDAPEKQRNALEVFNIVDRGDSACIDSQAAANFDAEHTLLALAATIQKIGIPRCIVCDRDPRIVGSQATDGFPSAFTRYLLCLGCAVDVLPPRRPDLKPFVERFQRTLRQECLDKYQPETASAANDCLPPYCAWYNTERPHQGDVNHNQPPLHQARHLSLPRIPETIDPDSWLQDFHNHSYRRHVDSRGTVQLWKYTYYIGKAYSNQKVQIRLDAHERVIHVEIGGKAIKTIPLKGLYSRQMEYLDFLGIMCDEARSEWKRHLWQQRFKLS